MGEHWRTQPADDGRSLVQPTDPDSVPPLDFVVGAPFHIARGMVTILYGSGGAGKSSFAAALGAHIAAGRSFLGAPVTKGRVFYGEFEGADQLLVRIQAKTEAAVEEDSPGAKETLRRDFKQRHYTPEEKARWGYAKGMIPALIKHLGHDYDVIIVDSFEAATMGDSVDAQFATKMMMQFTQLARETNTAVILIDHSSKTNAGSVYGSTKKTDFARVVIKIEADNRSVGHYLTLTSAKCNVAPKPKFPPVERVETDTTLEFRERRGMRVNISGLADAAHDRTAELIKDAQRQGAETRKQVYEYIQLEDCLSSPDAARKRVARADLQHLLPPAQHGRRK